LLTSLFEMLECGRINTGWNLFLTKQLIILDKMSVYYCILFMEIMALVINKIPSSLFNVIPRLKLILMKNIEVTLGFVIILVRVVTATN
jgi:hypothetical protein